MNERLEQAPETAEAAEVAETPTEETLPAAEEAQSAFDEESLRERLLSHPLVREAIELLETTRFRQDLDRVRAVYPDLAAGSPEEVGEVYCRLMATGSVDPVEAYEVQLAADRRRRGAPDDMVSASANGSAALYYSSAELDRLTQKELEDPAVFKKALLSLSKLK